VRGWEKSQPFIIIGVYHIIMESVREFLSTLAGDCKAASIDDWISPKLLYFKATSAIADFLAKDNNSSGLIYKLDSGWSVLSCVEMEAVDITTCNINIPNCRKLMKSKYQLPTLYESKFGSLVKNTSNLDYSKNYKNCFTPSQWNAISQREFQKDKYFFISNGFLYIPLKSQQDESPEILTVTGYFQDLKAVDIFNSKQGCGSCKPEEKVCKKFLDYGMVIPSYLTNGVRQEVVKQIAAIYLRQTADANPDLSSNIKSIHPNK
tara:strand:+ start:28030 stop:28818 length:789 start_codon:yes stop_codon:yes gene_type:complete